MRTALVLKPGIFTSFQDLGRSGMRKYGIAYAGAMDTISAINANILCGNPPDSTVIECTYKSPLIRMLMPTTIAVCGYDVSLIVDGIEQKENTYHCKEGDVIKININKGARGYFAFKGGFDIPSVQGSTSTDTISKIGGMMITSKMDLHCLEHTSSDTHSLLVKPDYGSNIIYMHRGPEYYLLSNAAQKAFLKQEWVITSKSSRMSYMLDGKPIKFKHNPMLSSPVLPGTIQLLPSGFPVILANDSQTTGGYSRVGIIEAKSYQVLSQKMPGEKIRLSLLEE